MSTLKDEFTRLGDAVKARNTGMTGLNPEDDGKSHINLHRSAKTKLGELLGPISRLSLKHPYLGPFLTHEGYRRFINSATPDDRLRYAKGAEVLGISESKVRVNRKFYRSLVIDGFFYKITQNPELLKLFTENTLPFAEYYTMPGSGIVVPTATASWHCPALDRLAEIIRTDATAYQPISFEDYNQRDNAADSAPHRTQQRKNKPGKPKPQQQQSDASTS